MNRIIKFRSWDDAEQMMYCFDLFNYASMNEDTQEELWPYNTRTTSPLMQFTGLHDKNGKEIYEGDVVKIWVVTTIEEWEHVESCEVVYKCGAFCIVNEKRSYSLYNKCKSQPLNKFFECEVIGNIYEHPHLIQKEAV